MSKLTLKNIAKNLKKSSKVHAKQSKQIENIMKKSPAKNTEAQTKYKIAVVPTIIIFKDGEEVARFQADLSFKMVATREEVQEEIDNQLMSDF